MREHRGELVMLDDPRLDPLWAAVGEAGVPVALHTADPVAFFQPVDERNEHWTRTRTSTSTSRRASPSWDASRAPRGRSCSAGRVLFGTDEIPPHPDVYRIHFRFMETDDEAFAHSLDDPPLMGRWTISGLDLPDDVLEQVYAGNALRLVPRLA
ncbi:hypothetical protein ABT158_10930 [Nonomuraea sp. NPDC001636]|uniref:hypothetical protein n=1 Tax=Nonomuraea sp. NPDC001636 TaxID=3154391 RepID=UPI00332E2AAA